MLDKIKERLATILISLGGLLAIIVGFKLKKLGKLEAQDRARELEKEVADQRVKVEEQKRGINESEKNLRRLKAEYNHHRNIANRESGPGDDAA